MPLSHLNITVSDLPTSTSFFLASLQPLGYRYVGRTDNCVGFGPESGNRADFWISEERKGVPASAAHIAFPAPDRDAVNAFFIAGLKAGGKVHGEPRLRDPDQGYFSAAVIDYDGNSVEAVHLPAAASERALTVVEKSSKVSRSIPIREKKKLASGSDIGSAVKSVSKAPTQVSTAHHRSVAPAPASPPPNSQTSSKDDSSSKTVVGTLLGAAAGAAIAYAMCKGESESETAPPPSHRPLPPPQYSESKPKRAPSVSAAQLLPEEYSAPKAIEAPPSNRDGMSDYARSVLSKNPRASTIFDGLDRYSQVLGGGNGGSSVAGSTRSRRHSMNGSVVIASATNENMPIRAIEGIPSDYDGNNGENHSEIYYGGSQASYAHNAFNPPTPIRSFVDGDGRSDMMSLRSASTLKPSGRAESKVSTSSSRRSHAHARSGRALDDISIGTGSSRSNRGWSQAPSAVTSAVKVPLPASSVMTKSSMRSSGDRHGHRGSGSKVSAAARSHAPSTSLRTARDIPLPASEVSTATYGTVREKKDKGYSSGGAGGGSKVSSAARSSKSKKSGVSKFDSDEPLWPSDSASQISSVRSGRSRRG